MKLFFIDFSCLENELAHLHIRALSPDVLEYGRIGHYGEHQLRRLHTARVDLQETFKLSGCGARIVRGARLTLIPPYSGIGSLALCGIHIFVQLITLMKSSWPSSVRSLMHMCGCGGFLK